MATLYEEGDSSTARRTLNISARLLRWLHLDGPLLAALAAVMAFGLFVLYSASGESLARFEDQAARFAIALVAMAICAKTPPAWLRRLAPILYGVGVLL